MGGKLVSVVSVPFYRLKASTLLPHSPEELSGLTITLRTRASVSVLQKPLGKCSSVLYRSHILFDEETRNKEERISIIILWVHCQLALVVEETRVTSTGTLEYLHVVFQWVDTTGYRRNHTLRIMLWCLLPIGYLRIVGAVEVATTHRIEVLEGCYRQRTSSDSLHTIRYLEIVRRIFVWRELKFCARMPHGPPRLPLQSFSVHRLNLLGGILLLGKHNSIPTIAPIVLNPFDVKL